MEQSVTASLLRLCWLRFCVTLGYRQDTRRVTPINDNVNTVDSFTVIRSISESDEQASEHRITVVETCFGEGQYGGNLENVKLCAQKDMGVFILSALGKGGRLYAPSKKLQSLTLPDLEPISYGALWLWHHEHHNQDCTPIHSIVCGAARPSDLDQSMNKPSSFPRKKLLHI
jgi:predicted aldo/keto reductase-like oxidoreductase